MTISGFMRALPNHRGDDEPATERHEGFEAKGAGEGFECETACNEHGNNDEIQEHDHMGILTHA